MSRSVAIVARAATAVLAPFTDPEWECWGLAWVTYPRMDRLFDIHDPDFKRETPEDYNSQRNPAYLNNVRERHAGVPVYSLPGAEFDAAVEYPLDAVLTDIGRTYLECTVAYMMALAIHEKVDRIGLWGCHFTGKNEYAWQRPSVTWLIGLAEGRGIKVEICPGTPLMVSGYEDGRYGLSRRMRFAV